MICYLHVIAVEYPYNYTIFPTIDRNFEQSDLFLDKGGRAFLFNLKEQNNKLYIVTNTQDLPFHQVMATVAEYSKQHPAVLITLIIKGKFNPELLLNNFRELCLTNDIYFKKTEQWPKPTEIIRNKKHFVILTEARLPKPFLSFNDYCFQTSYYRLNVANHYNSWFVNNPANDLMVYYPINSPQYGFENLSEISIKKSDSEIRQLLSRKKTVLEMSNEIWNRSGRVPNFMIFDLNQIDDCINAAHTINSASKYLFDFQYPGKILTEVHWIGMDSLITSGFFSLPTQFLGQKIKPYKNEYTFSPDVLLLDLKNSKYINTFLVFKEKVDNTTPILKMDFIHNRFSSKESNFNFGNTLRTDSGLLLNGKVSFVDCGNDYSINNEKPLSVSTWVYPHSFDSFRIILSKNFSFSLKLYNRFITFTTPEVAMGDYFAITKELEINKWSHIVVVFRPNNSISFYLNGQLIDTQKAHGFKVSQNTLMIGSNERGRYFHGLVKDVFLWNRALREEEITALYNHTHSVYNNNNWRYCWFLLILLPVAYIMFIIRKKRQVVELNTIPESLPFFSESDKPLEVVDVASRPLLADQQESLAKNTQEIMFPQLCFFGSLQFLDSNGQNMIGMFPPKILQLFVLIACYSVSNKNGISSKEISQILWEDYEPEKAENNRKYSLNKLKQILEDFKQINLIYEDKLWRIDFHPQMQFDYQEYQYFIAKGEKCIEQDVTAIIKVLKRGLFLNSITAECFDSLKNSISNQIIDLMLLLAEKTQIKTNSKICFDMAEIIFLFDNVNEEANALMIHSLLAEGKNSLAHKAYEQFCKRYAELFGEEYKISFRSLCK